MNAKQLLDTACAAYINYPKTHAAVMVAFKKLGFDHSFDSFPERRTNFLRWVAPSHQAYTSRQFGHVTSIFYNHVVIAEILRSTEPELEMWRQFIIDLEQIEQEKQEDLILLDMIKQARNTIYCRLECSIRDTLVSRINRRILLDAKSILDRGDVLIAIHTDVIVHTGQPLEQHVGIHKQEAVSAVVTLNNAFFCCTGGHASSGIRNVRPSDKQVINTRKEAYKMIESSLK